MFFRFVDQNLGGTLFTKMTKGGLNVTEAGFDEVLVLVARGEEWADEDAWVCAIEDHYACVFDDTVN